MHDRANLVPLRSGARISSSCTWASAISKLSRFQLQGRVESEDAGAYRHLERLIDQSDCAKPYHLAPVGHAYLSELHDDEMALQHLLISQDEGGLDLFSPPAATRASDRGGIEPSRLDVGSL